MNLAQTKNFLLTGAALTPVIGLAGVSGANAADMALKAPPPVAAPSWAGFYLGVNIGGAGEHSDYTDPNLAGTPTPTSHSGAAFIGGGQIGYNWQSGTFVYGLEGDISELSTPSSLFFHIAPPGDPRPTYGSNVPWLATVRGRLGVTVGDGNTLIYGTGGAAFGRVNAFTNELFLPPVYNDYSSTRVGWAAGGGVERMILPHWTIGLEGLFVDLGSYTKASSVGGKCCATVHNTVAIGRFKLNFKF